ncbi:hypothetical protein HDU79_011854 [Rhizoclosmatium sp. JEL0117]|nr:hypothetical protein HDU79_011854 [Rhizoclosmatium sp. JEL0117]
MIQSGEPLTTKLICPVPGCGCIILGKEGAVKDSDFVLEPKVTFPALPKGVPSSEPTESSNFTYLWKVKDKMDFWFSKKRMYFNTLFSIGAAIVASATLASAESPVLYARDGSVVVLKPLLPPVAGFPLGAYYCNGDSELYKLKQVTVDKVEWVIDVHCTAAEKCVVDLIGAGGVGCVPK